MSLLFSLFRGLIPAHMRKKHPVFAALISKTCTCSFQQHPIFMRKWESNIKTDVEKIRLGRGLD
jgi:hypothetical protein